MHLVITDSGLGGLSICAGVERALRQSETPRETRLTYVNAWPEQGRGYNDLPDMPARAQMFDRALQRMAALRPDLIVIACNTLSIVYEHTMFRRNARVPVQGIVSAGVDLFAESLAAAPGAPIVLMGTRTTIDAGVHRELLLQQGVPADRIGAVSCHGLATAIEQGARSAATRELLEACTARVDLAPREGQPLFAGLCCTHYELIADQIQAALARRTGRQVIPLDPNGRLVRDVIGRISQEPESTAATGRAVVEVISKVVLNDAQRLGMAELIEPVSPATADALRTYRRLPDLFQESA